MNAEEEFVETIKKHEGTIYKVIMSYTRDQDAVRDMYQEVVFQLWKSFPKFKGKSSLNTWIYRVVLNTVLSILRNDTRRKTKIDEISQLDFTYEYDHELDQKIDNLYDAIYTLSHIERAIMLLFLEEKSHKEIADIIGISPTNVGTKISRIKKKLLSLIKEN